MSRIWQYGSKIPFLVSNLLWVSFLLGTVLVQEPRLASYLKESATQRIVFHLKESGETVRLSGVEGKSSLRYAIQIPKLPSEILLEVVVPPGKQLLFDSQGKIGVVQSQGFHEVALSLVHAPILFSGIDGEVLFTEFNPSYYWHRTVIRIFRFLFIVGGILSLILTLAKCKREVLFGLIMAAIPVGFVASLEWGLRSVDYREWFGANREYVNFPTVHPELAKKSPIFSWEGPYRKMGKIEREGISYYPIFRAERFRINSLGLRCEEPNELKAPMRIAVIGGSTTFGAWSWDDETIPKSLESELRRRGRNVDVCNFGLEGMNYPTSIKLLQKMQPLYHFTHVVFYQGVNSFSSAREVHEQKQFVDPWWWKIRIFDFTRVLGIKLKNMQHEQKLMDSLSDQYLAEHMKAWQQGEDYGRENEIKTVAILQPVVFTKANPSKEESMMIRTVDFYMPYLQSVYLLAAEKIRAKYPGTHQDFTDVIHETEMTYEDWCHMNARGNRAVALGMADLVEKQWGESRSVK